MAGTAPAKLVPAATRRRSLPAGQGCRSEGGGKLPRDQRQGRPPDMAAKGVERLSGQPSAEKIIRSGRPEVQGRDAFGQSHAREALVSGQESDGVFRAGLGLMTS